MKGFIPPLFEFRLNIELEGIMRRIWFNRRGRIFPWSCSLFVSLTWILSEEHIKRWQICTIAWSNKSRNASRAGQILADRTCVGTSITIEVDSFKVMVLHVVLLRPLNQELAELYSEPRTMDSISRNFCIRTSSEVPVPFHLFLVYNDSAELF